MKRFIIQFFVCVIPWMSYPGLPLFYWEEGGFVNFGDVIAQVLVERMVETSLRLYRPSMPCKEKKLLGLGSLLVFARNGDVVWGSGLHGKLPNKESYSFCHLDVRSVRGPVTRQFLIDQFGIHCPEIYGDPALLLPCFFPEFKRKENPTFEYIIIPHYTDVAHFPKSQYPNVVYPTEPWYRIIEKMLDSKFVISSTLHGIIAAEAFGIPARALKIGSSQHNPTLKFQDYYLGTGRPNFQFATSLEEALQMQGEPPFQCDLKQLCNAFPFEYWQEDRALVQQALAAPRGTMDEDFLESEQTYDYDYSLSDYPREDLLSDHALSDYPKEGLSSDHALSDYPKEGLLSDRALSNYLKKDLLSDHALSDYPKEGLSSDYALSDYPKESKASSHVESAGLVNLEEFNHPCVLETKRIMIPGHPYAYNPSIIRWKGKLLLLFRTYLANGSANEIGLIYLDEQFTPIGSPHLIRFHAPDPYCRCKRQDPKLVQLGERLYIIYNNAVFNEVRRMVIAEIVQVGEEFQVYESRSLINFEEEQPMRSEKNWVPFDFEGGLYFGYSLAPHKILRFTPKSNFCEKVSCSPTCVTWDWGVLRGGTPALLEGDEYLAFFHSVRSMASVQSGGEKMSHYFIGAYTFLAKPPFTITQFSKAPLLDDSFYHGKAYKMWRPLQVVFPGGYIADRDTVWLFYGRQDHEIWVARLDKQALLNSLVPVQ